MELTKYSNKYIHYYNDAIPEIIINIFNKKYSQKIKSFADLGCGDGAILYSLLKNSYLDNVNKIVAVDVSKERITNVKKISDKIQCIVADICELEIPGNLDLVISEQVIEHIQDEEKLIASAHNILTKGGLFFLSTVYKKWYGWYFYRCNGKWVLDPTHLREYTHDNQLVELVKKYNFEILEDKKTLQWFSITDFIFKRISLRRDIYTNKVINFFRNIKMPIIGYYNWELMMKKI